MTGEQLFELFRACTDEDMEWGLWETAPYRTKALYCRFAAMLKIWKEWK